MEQNPLNGLLHPTGDKNEKNSMRPLRPHRKCVWTNSEGEKSFNDVNGRSETSLYKCDDSQSTGVRNISFNI